MDVGEQRRPVVQAARWNRHVRLPARGPVRDPLRDQSFDAFQLHACDDRTDVSRLIEGGADPQRRHARLQLLCDRDRDALLHEQPRTGAANLTLVQPDAVDETFDGTVEISVLEHDEG